MRVGEGKRGQGLPVIGVVLVESVFAARGERAGVADELSGTERRRELYCEVIRDVGILVLVFAPLDIVLYKPDWSGAWVALLVGIAAVLVYIGVQQDPRSQGR